MAAIAEQVRTIEHQSFRAEAMSRGRTTEAMHRVPDLAYEVAKARQDSSLEALYLLPGTGFHVRSEINSFLANIESGMSFDQSMEQVEQNVQGLKVEYLVEQPVFPIVLEKRIHKGRLRLVGNLSGGKPLVESTSPDEREGAVREVIEQVEERLLKAESGALVVLDSPAEWSGYQQTKDGRLEKLNGRDIQEGRADEIRYPDSQIYCFQVRGDGSIRGFTLKTDMNISQNEELLRRLGVDAAGFNSAGSSRVRIKNVIKNFVVVPPEMKMTIEDISGEIEDIKGEGVAYRDSIGKPRTFSEMRRLLKDPEPLWTLDETTKKLVDSFREYAGWRMMRPDEKMKGDLEIALGHVVLDLMHKIRPHQVEKQMKVDAAYAPETIRFDPRETLRDMQKLAGCAGGGSKNKSIIDSITARIGEKDWEYHSGDCVKCHAKNTDVGPCSICKDCQKEFDQAETLAQAA